MAAGRPVPSVTRMYDAIIVGARCAGSPTAMLLARQGYRVLLVDRARFPSDLMRLHYVRQPGVALLRRWGLLDRVVASNAPLLPLMTQDQEGSVLTGTAWPIDGVTDAIGPRRKVLDGILVEAAVEAGAELREGFTVQEVLTDGDRVTGIRGRDAGGAPVTEHARVTVGADGMRSIVARTVDAPVYEAQPSLVCYYHSYWSGVPTDRIEVYVRGRRIILAFPTNDGLTCVVVGWPHGEFQDVRSDIEGSFRSALDLAPDLAGRVRAGRREERFGGMADLPNFFRRPFGPGWALAGDAGYHKDPYLAHGIMDAFRSADLLARALDDGFSGREALHEALAGYERRRNESLPLYRLNLQLAALEPASSEQLRLRSALRGNPEETSRFLGVAAGTVPVAEFFAPENLARIMREAA
jgi:flavin-dependent dehydrogenase